MAGHAQLKFVMTECSKTQIRLTWPKYELSHFNGVVSQRLCTYQWFPPEWGWWAYPGVDNQNGHYPQEFDRRLWHRGGTLDASARKFQRHHV